MRRSNICNWISSKRRERGWVEATLEEIMTKDFLKLVKDVKPQIQEMLQTVNKKNINKIHLGTS